MPRKSKPESAHEISKRTLRDRVAAELKNKPLGDWGDGRFFKLTDRLLNSDAYVSLGSSAKCVLIDYMTTWSYAVYRDDLVRDRWIKFSYGQCRACVSEDTFYRCMSELQLTGFLVRVDRQQLSRGKANLYRARSAWQKITAADIEQARPGAERKVAMVRQRQGLLALHEQQQQLLLDIDVGMPDAAEQLDTIERIDPAGIGALPPLSSFEEETG